MKFKELKSSCINGSVPNSSSFVSSNESPSSSVSVLFRNSSPSVSIVSFGLLGNAFPSNPNETIDTDGDELRNNTDTDDDGDSLEDTKELEFGTDPLIQDDFNSLNFM